MEIIEIGAVTVDGGRLEPVSEYQSFLPDPAPEIDAVLYAADIDS